MKTGEIHRLRGEDGFFLPGNFSISKINNPAKSAQIKCGCNPMWAEVRSKKNTSPTNSGADKAAWILEGNVLASKRQSLVGHIVDNEQNANPSAVSRISYHSKPCSQSRYFIRFVRAPRRAKHHPFIKTVRCALVLVNR
jgi:hypothetical protein